MADGGTSSGSLFQALLKGRAQPAEGLKVHLSGRDGADLHDKMRQAYWWIVNNAILCPYYDIQYGAPVQIRNEAGDRLEIHDAMSFSSFVLIPLLTLFTCRRALMIGGPGRGKTTSAFLMALLAGMEKDEVQRAILRGHPQLSTADLLGAPLPADMMKAEEMGQIRVSWRKWITARVKIVDEYNRIPTKTQSALLSLLAEGYAEMFDQYVYAGRSSWFLTANDDAGGGTFQVIEALKDRIDVVVRAVPFNSGFTQALLRRIESGADPQDLLPADIVFSKEELDAIYKAIQMVAVPAEVLEFLGFFLGQLDYCRMASPEFENKNKDTLHLSGKTVGAVCTEDCPLDKQSHLCSQTENGVSVRSYLTCLHFAKGMAYFRGNQEVAVEDMRQIIPWVLHEKLRPNTRSPFFEAPDHQGLIQDRVAWIRSMMDRAWEQFQKAKPVRISVSQRRQEIDKGLEGLSQKDAETRMHGILGEIKQLMTTGELSGFSYEMIVQLKSFHSRYQNYVLWLKRQGSRGP